MPALLVWSYSQFILFLYANNVSLQTPADVEKVDIVEYLAELARKELTGIARARKMSAIREYFRFLEGIGAALSTSLLLDELPERRPMTVIYVQFYFIILPKICPKLSYT